MIAHYHDLPKHKTLKGLRWPVTEHLKKLGLLPILTCVITDAWALWWDSPLDSPGSLSNVGSLTLAVLECLQVHVIMDSH